MEWKTRPMLSAQHIYLQQEGFFLLHPDPPALLRPCLALFFHQAICIFHEILFTIVK